MPFELNIQVPYSAGAGPVKVKGRILPACFLLFMLLFTGSSVKPAVSLGQSILTDHKVYIQLYSKTALENIVAEANDGVSFYNPSNRLLAFQVKIRSFVFPHALMQEHFNENYLESDKFPLAAFKGSIQGTQDFSAGGEYQVTVKGMLTMHGVSVERVIQGKVINRNGVLYMEAVFNVPCTDHHIDIPTIVTAKIAEAITVTVRASYGPVNIKTLN